MPACPGNKTFFQQGLITTVSNHGRICGGKNIPLEHEVHEALEYYTGRLRTTDIRQVDFPNRPQEFPGYALMGFEVGIICADEGCSSPEPIHRVVLFLYRKSDQRCRAEAYMIVPLYG